METNRTKTGMAVTSLVLGILGCLCFGLLAGLPAIILGHVAYSHARNRPEEYGGAGLAIAGFITGYVSLLTTLVLAALLLPALSQARHSAERISCVNNLKQVGLVFRLWANDNAGRFPFNVPEKEGGTLELCQPDAEGFDANAWKHFQVMSGYLGTPRMLVCPADSSKQPAASFVDLGPGNVSYQLRTGKDLDPAQPGELLARCPIHNHELRCDGSVQQAPRWR